MLDLGELLLVKTPTEVILRVTIVVKKQMMVVMKQDWVLLQQLRVYGFQSTFLGVAIH